MRRTRSAGAVAALVGLIVYALLAGCALAPKAADAGREGSAGSGAGPAEPTVAPRDDQPAPVPSGVPADLMRFYEQRLDWQSCASGESFECATLEVPLDYAEPEGDSIELAVLRVRARDNDNRLGSLVVNPGGPGGSGIEYAAAAPFVISRPVLDRYDIVGFDPRGVGQSTPVDCVSDKEMDTYLAADGSPDTAAEQQNLLSIARRFAAGCETRSGELLPHVSTVDAARDMDILRSALGDEELTYLGKSYGTFLGATYAGLFPSRAGRLVLDGAIDPTLTARDLGLEQAKGFEVALRAFITDCVRRSGCPLGTTTEEAYRTLDDLLARTDRSPLPTGESRQLTQALATTGIVMPLYVKEYWPRLRTALGSALDGDGSRLLALADEYAERGPDGRYRSNSGEAILAVNCLDRPDLTSVAEARAEEPAFEKASPRFGSFILWGSLTCAEWPVKPTGKPAAIKATGTRPILVVGTTRDPATPYEWSERLAEQLDAGVLLSRDGDGHTAYMQGNTCIDRAVEAFLLDGKPPRNGTHCPA
ncbi:alpha/beta hydrolase [Actinopolymorpha sp. B17G11]|uniref:alpha/beta hydrolase n=1 Tax=Actinopolymorpha sp. B17G11 TaxID=3160861 RepID=UPI0032E41627